MNDEMKTKSERSTIRRLPARGNYEQETIYSIIDEGLICHVGFSLDDKPFVIPMTYGRRGDTLYLHGSVASRLQRAMAAGVEVCVSITLLDGLVLARSAFHHSMNYRSVVIFGRAMEVTDQKAMMEGLEAIVEHIVPGRWNEARQPNEKEIRATTLVAVHLAEASAKIRSGPPKDDAEDYSLDVWAGEIPLRQVVGVPVDDPQLSAGIRPSKNVTSYRRGK